jgi:ABC-type cobalamin/Fe3+-siderophores transport system ATPase subunit
MVLHDLTQIYRYSTKAVLLNQGKIVALGETEEVIRGTRWRVSTE